MAGRDVRLLRGEITFEVAEEEVKTIFSEMSLDQSLQIILKQNRINNLTLVPGKLPGKANVHISFASTDFQVMLRKDNER